MTAARHPRAEELVRLLEMSPHPEGGHYREVFRSGHRVATADGRAPRQALSSIDFLLDGGAFSAWHRVASDEAWHLLEGGPLRLWLISPDLQAFSHLDLAPVGAVTRPRGVVPAGWWQAAEPLGDYAYVGATVGPGFVFDDFSFGRADPGLRAALQGQAPALMRLL
jgi:predicted cupin superfamily sugar epimerase